MPLLYDIPLAVNTHIPLTVQPHTAGIQQSSGCAVHYAGTGISSVCAALIQSPPLVGGRTGGSCQAPPRPPRLVLLGQGSERRALVLALAGVGVEGVAADVVDDVVGQQVLGAEAPAQGAPHLRGAGLVVHPLAHQEHVAAVAPQRVRLVSGALRLQPAAAHAHEAVRAGQLLQVLRPPHARHAEAFQEVRPAQQLQLGRWTLAS